MSALNTASLTDQVNHLHGVLQWIKRMHYNAVKLEKARNGIDLELYSIEYLERKRAEIQATPGMEPYENLVQRKMELAQLEDRMRHHTAISFNTSKPEEERVASATLMNELNDLNKQLQREYEQLLFKIEPELYSQFPKIYNMIINGTDIRTVKHCLSTLDLLQKNRINADQAANMGIDYEENKGAPAGLFDFMLEGPRIKNGTKAVSYTHLTLPTTPYV